MDTKPRNLKIVKMKQNDIKTNLDSTSTKIFVKGVTTRFYYSWDGKRKNK